jgi:predicted metal-dependent hydrolase
MALRDRYLWTGDGPTRYIGPMSEAYPAQYLEGLRLFNAEDFFESHEVLEELWAETQDNRKKFYQGLIQAAVALLHFGNGNLGGAKKVYLSSRKYLEAYSPEFEGLDVAGFLDGLQFCFQELLDDQERFPSGIELQDDRVPKIPIPGGTNAP